MRPEVLLSGVVSADVCARWLALIERRYAALDALHADPDFSLHSSSLRLRAVSEISLDEVLRAVVHGQLLSRLGDHLHCDIDQCWIRRQYAPHHAPPQHAAHSWHQDGALCFDFVAHAGKPLPANALLDMITCWIPLTACGENAPGLELVQPRIARMFAPAELTEPKLRAAFPPDAFERPVMAAGDALLLAGSTLHRTHVSPAMTLARTSIELRFFAAQPERLRGDCFVDAIRE